MEKLRLTNSVGTPENENEEGDWGTELLLILLILRAEESDEFASVEESLRTSR